MISLIGVVCAVKVRPYSLSLVMVTTGGLFLEFLYLLSRFGE